jgi:hypothetical protein
MLLDPPSENGDDADTRNETHEYNTTRRDDHPECQTAIACKQM